MRYFINQLASYISEWFSPIYQYFFPPVLVIPPVVMPELSLDNVLLQSTAHIDQILKSSLERINLNPLRLESLTEPRLIEPRSHVDVLLSQVAVFIPHRQSEDMSMFWREQEQHMRRQDERYREQMENPLSAWWKQIRLERRNAQFAVAVTLPENELYARKLEQLPDVDVDNDFICGISQEIMTNPVYDPAFPQQKYDLLVLDLWLRDHETNPITRTPLLTENLVYDEVLKSRIDEFMKETLSAQVSNFSTP